MVMMVFAGAFHVYHVRHDVNLRQALRMQLDARLREMAKEAASAGNTWGPWRCETGSLTWYGRNRSG
jgi:hypothetical protein